LDCLAVYVSNIASTADQKAITDFFSFCGRITGLTLRPTSSGVQEAVVLFETESASKTALLLTNAFIIDRAIVVSPYTPEVGIPLPEVGGAQASASEKQFGVPDQHRTKTSVVASVLAAGYTVGEDAMKKAKDYDEKHSLSQTVKTKATEIDKKLGISETAAAAASYVGSLLNSVDNSFGISAKAAVARDSVVAAGTQAKAKAMANPVISDTVNKVSSTVDQLKMETQQEIEKKRRHHEMLGESGPDEKAPQPVS